MFWGNFRGLEDVRMNIQILKQCAAMVFLVSTKIVLFLYRIQFHHFVLFFLSRSNFIPSLEIPLGFMKPNQFRFQFPQGRQALPRGWNKGQPMRGRHLSPLKNPHFYWLFLQRSTKPWSLCLRKRTKFRPCQI